MIEGTEEFWEQESQVEKFASKDPDRRLVEWIEARDHPSSVRALDLGCAGGRNTVLLTEKGCDVIAVDASAAMVEETRRRLAAMVGEEEAHRRVRQARMDQLDWIGDASIDLLVALGIYHAAQSENEWDRALAASARVLAPGGTLLVSVFAPGTDLTGEGTRPVPGEDHLFDGMPGHRRAFLVDASTLDRELGRHGLEPAERTETVAVETGRGRRVTVNGLYSKPHAPRQAD